MSFSAMCSSFLPLCSLILNFLLLVLLFILPTLVLFVILKNISSISFLLVFSSKWIEVKFLSFLKIPCPGGPYTSHWLYRYRVRHFKRG